MIADQLDQTSSIGAVWPPQPSPHARLRGFYTDEVIRDAAGAARLAAIFAEQQQRFAEYPELTRLSIRAVVDVGSLATLHALGAPVEGVLPLANTDDGLCIAYMAANEPERQTTAAELEQYDELLTRTLERPRHSDNVLDVLSARELTAHTVDHDQAEALVASFLPLYGEFGYDADDVLTLLSNQRNTIVYIREGDQVISTAMAEVHQLNVPELGSLRIGEITEAYTLPAYRGQGLYRLASRLVIDNVLAEHGSSLNALYGEVNLTQPGVVYAAHENGRRFSYFDDAADGIPNSGVLQRNFAIGSTATNTQYSDFALSYVPL